MYWPNITTCGQYPYARVMSERYFVFTVAAQAQANAHYLRLWLCR